MGGRGKGVVGRWGGAGDSVNAVSLRCWGHRTSEQTNSTDTVDGQLGCVEDAHSRWSSRKSSDRERSHACSVDMDEGGMTPKRSDTGGQD